MKVYVLAHREDDYDWNSCEHRGVYANPDLALADAHTTRVPVGKSVKGQPREMKTVTAGCCEVEEFEVVQGGN